VLYDCPPRFPELGLTNASADAGDMFSPHVLEQLLMIRFGGGLPLDGGAVYLARTQCTETIRYILYSHPQHVEDAARRLQPREPTLYPVTGITCLHHHIQLRGSRRNLGKDRSGHTISPRNLPNDLSG
jgi:hypothetical protein